MKKLLAVSVFAFVAVSGQAFAADAIGIPAPVVPVGPVVDSSSIWDGFYAGLNAGYGWGEGELSIPGATGQEDIEGWLGGAQVGYNFSSGGIVFGVEADLQAADIVYSEEIAPGVDADLGIESVGTVRARIGADLGGFMPYVTGGLAFGQLGYEIDAGGPTISDSEWGWGWAAGAGVEAMVFDNVSIKGEYLYTEISDVTFDIGGIDVDADAYAHSARIGFNYHF